MVAIRDNATRLILIIAGAMALAWSIAVIPAFWSERVISDVGNAVVAGEVFKSENLAAVEVGVGVDGIHALRSSMLAKAAVIRLRQVEDSIRAGDPERTDARLKSLTSIVDDTFQNAPNDSFLWLIKFWLDVTRNGLRPENLQFLKMSYDLGPHEGWIAVKRSPIALAAFPALPNDLAELAISEFVSLVRWGLIPEAAAIAAGPGRSVRGILFPRLKDLKYEQRRAFADAVYRRELDDVLVPGIKPPSPQIPMPVLPPGF